MCDKAILENGGTLEPLPDCYKIQKMCNQAVNNVPGCYKTQEMRNKAINTYPSTIKFVPECCETQEMCYQDFLDFMNYWISFCSRLI